MGQHGRRQRAGRAKQAAKDRIYLREPSEEVFEEVWTRPPDKFSLGEAFNGL